MATVPTSPPVHGKIATPQLWAYIADYAQQWVTGSPPVVPSSPPVQKKIADHDLIAYIADSAQDIAS